MEMHVVWNPHRPVVTQQLRKKRKELKPHMKGHQ